MVVEEKPSKYSGKLQVLKTFPWDTPHISTGYLTQSGGLVQDVWKPVLPTLRNPAIKTVLILGLAGGTLAKLIYKIRPDIQITGVEIDPTMIYLGKKYLGLDKIPNLKIIIQDANAYSLNPKDPFDVIFVDLYINDKVPSFVYSKKFISKLKCKLLIINHLFYDEDKKQKAQELIKLLESCANQIRLQRILTNVLIIATPKTHPEIPTPLHQTVF